MIATRGLAAIAGAAALGIAQAAAQVPAAMVLEVSGTTEPRLEALTEIEPGSSAVLSPGARLTFVHYKTCRTVSVEGGSLRWRLTDFSATGKLLSEQKRCPRRFTLAAGGSSQVSGLMLRGAPRIMATRPILLLTGPAAGAFNAAEIRLDDKVVANLAMSGQRAALPDGAPALTAGKTYALVLLPKAGGPPLREEFTATETGSGSTDRSIVLALD